MPNSNSAVVNYVYLENKLGQPQFLVKYLIQIYFWTNNFTSSYTPTLTQSAITRKKMPFSEKTSTNSI